MEGFERCPTCKKWGWFGVKFGREHQCAPIWELELANHIDGCVRVAADALKRAEVAEAVCRITSRVGSVQASGDGK
jgi:hypothetical protein